MNLKIVKLDPFVHNAKRLYKKYKNLPKDLETLLKDLNQNPKAGVDLGNNCYKIRLANSSIPTGKSGGFRVVYYYYNQKEELFLVTMFSKRDMESISDKKILELAKKYGLV
jgi:hypothetical protein